MDRFPVAPISIDGQGGRSYAFELGGLKKRKIAKSRYKERMFMFDTWITEMKDGSARSKAEAEWKNKPNWESERLYELGGLAGRKEYFSLRYQHEFDALFASVFHPSPYLTERALLALHYLAGGEEQERLNELTDLICADAFEEENELRRGRKHWV